MGLNVVPAPCTLESCLSSTRLSNGGRYTGERRPCPLSEEKVSRLVECLNSEERERSGKFRFEQDQRRFVSAKGSASLHAGASPLTWRQYGRLRNSTTLS
jgi:hypothetical protein